MFKKYIILFISLTLITISLPAQKDFYKSYSFNEADTIRGALRPERTAYDVTFYDLNISIDPEERHIEGYVDIFYTATEKFTRLQVDLFANMEIKSINFQNKALTYERVHNAIFINFPKQKKGKKGHFRIYYKGHPTTAKSAPWDGGFVWKKDAAGQPWIGVACEGTGASLWWPNKDHLSDEPDSMSIKIAVPTGLTCVSNGNLRDSVLLDNGYTRFDWFVSYPINNYNVTVNIADYAHFSDVYTAEDGAPLPLDYYVLRENLAKAKKQFQQVPKMLACYEHYLGKYPFWEDGYALVETPYLGMEHQGAIAYGNGYTRGYQGGMIPSDMNWDYIIIHETGHEYFGNSISVDDHAEMWIHESFTTYLEALYVECVYSYKDAMRYLDSQRLFIVNREPILGPLNVNFDSWVSSDHYFKGAWMLNTLRHAINDDELWFDCLKSFYQRYAISNVKTQDFIDYVNHCTKRDFEAFFDQYLRYPKPPIFEYELTAINDKSCQIRYRWDAAATGFNMPLLVGNPEQYQQIFPTPQWQEMVVNISSEKFKVATELFYILSRQK